jgi:predicted deacylase
MVIKKGFIPTLKSIDLSTRRVPFLWASAGVPGPTVWLTAAIHGDEVTGTAVIQSVFKRLQQTPLSKGNLYAFPVLNTSGFETISRRNVYDNEDLNRSFTQNPNGSISERLASMILSSVTNTHPDYVIDLHTDSMNSIAYTLIDFPRSVTNDKTLIKSIAVARHLGFVWIIETFETFTYPAGYPLEQCFTGRLATKGIPAVTIELGGPMVVMEEFRKAGLEAIWNFLISLGMVPGIKHSLDFSRPKEVYIFKERIITQSTGIIDYRVKPGDEIQKGQILGKIRNVFGEVIEIIRSPINGILLSHEDQSATFPGQILFTIAVKSSLEEIAKLKEMA